MAKKRDRLEVIRDILEAVRENRQIKPTRLLYASNLSPQMFKSYVDELLKKRFVKLDNDKHGKNVFCLEKKGNEFLEQYRVIEGFVENFGL